LHLQRPLGLAQDGGEDFGDLAVGHVRQACEDFPEIRVRIKAASPAAFDDSVNDGAALSGLGIADKQPVLLVMESFA